MANDEAFTGGEALSPAAQLFYVNFMVLIKYYKFKNLFLGMSSINY